MSSRINRLSEIKSKRKVDAFLFTSPATVKHLSGYFFNFDTGPSPFHYLPAALFVIPAENFSLLLADNEQDKLITIKQDIHVACYSSYDYKQALHFTEDFSLQLLNIIEANKASKARVGVEINSFPYGLFKVLSQKCPGMKFTDITEEINYVKAIKDEDEIACIRQACILSDIGQASVLQYAKKGLTELELFSWVRLAMEKKAGTRVPMMTDLVSGKATSSGGGNPTDRIIQENDLILSDLTPCLNGYWSDTCNTIVVGTPTAEQRKVFTLVKEALEIGINAIRPGIMAKEVDQNMRKHLEGEGGFGHHGGHGVGTVYHEEPRITPYNTMLLKPGMVIALEPAVYKNDYGIRLEHLVVVTPSGCEIISKFDHCFEQTLRLNNTT